MSEPLKDILKKRIDAPKEPSEFLIIRKFIQDKYSVTPQLSVSKTGITIGVPSSAIAGNLRFDLHSLLQLLSSRPKLIIRINR